MWITLISRVSDHPVIMYLSHLQVFPGGDPPWIPGTWSWRCRLGKRQAFPCSSHGQPVCCPTRHSHPHWPTDTHSFHHAGVLVRAVTLCGRETSAAVRAHLGSVKAQPFAALFSTLMGNAIRLKVRRPAANEAAVISSCKRLFYDFVVSDFLSPTCPYH